MKLRTGYKWLLLALLFATFFLGLGTRQIYNAILPQLKIDFAARLRADAGEYRILVGGSSVDTPVSAEIVLAEGKVFQ